MGEEVGGYVLGELLTQGGMASVYLGKRVAPGGFEKTVVFKRLRPELESQPPLLALFLREASLSAGLEHPSIVRTFDLAQLGGSYYLVMEYVRGGDLRLLLRRARRRGQRFSAAAALRIGRELLTALEYAHSRCTADGAPLGLSHRDVSPANILISTEGEVKLSDFGIAQASAEEGLGGATGVRLRGKVGYMSPEQACGGPVDNRSDLFALAAVLYEVLTGKRLFIGQPNQPLTEIYQAAIVPPSQLCPELPAACDAVLSRALSARKEDRYQSAREFYRALLDLTRQHDLWLDHLGFAEHLREVCGLDPNSWRVLDERTGTAIIPPIGDDDAYGDDDDDSGVDGARAADPSGERTGLAILLPRGQPTGAHDGPRATERGEYDPASAPRAGDKNRDRAAAIGDPGGLAPTGEPSSDHVITVPWPTVVDRELLPASPDDTMPLLSAALIQGDGLMPRPQPMSGGPRQAPGNDPASASGSGFVPVRLRSRAAPQVIEHTRPPSPGRDLDAVTLLADLVDTTAPLAKATLPPEGTDQLVSPVLTTAQVARLAPLAASPSASATRPMHKLPLGARLRDCGRELLNRVGGWTGLTLLFLVLGSLIFTVWIATGAQVGSWVWTHLQAP